MRKCGDGGNVKCCDSETIRKLGIAEGVFRGHTDRNRILVMVVEPEALDAIRAFLKEARKRFDQEAMYLEFHPVEFELVE